MIRRSIRGEVQASGEKELYVGQARHLCWSGFIKVPSLSPLHAPGCLAGNEACYPLAEEDTWSEEQKTAREEPVDGMACSLDWLTRLHDSLSLLAYHTRLVHHSSSAQRPMFFAGPSGMLKVEPGFSHPLRCSLEVPMLDQQHLTKALSHVLWIGGSPCSGKSTISHTIARISVFVVYQVDAWSGNHLARLVAAGDAQATAFLRMTMSQRWIERSVETLTQEALSIWTRSFSLVIEDLLMLPKETFIVAEGNFLPACVAPYLSSSHQAIWLVPTEAFCEQGRREKWAELARRQKRHGVYDEGSDPEQLRRNMIGRDCRLARSVKQQAEERSLTVHVVDGSRSREEMTELVEQHFDPYLIASIKK